MQSLFCLTSIMAIREYFILWSLGILCVFSLAIGIEKMTKIILSNYVLTALAITLPMTLSSLMWWLAVHATDIAVTLEPVFANKTIIVLIVYLLLLLLLFLKSRVSIHFHVWWLQKFLLTMFCIPMTIVSITLTLQFAVLGLQAFDYNALQNLVWPLPIQDIYKQFVLQTPVIVTIHAFLTAIIVSHINRTPKMPSFSFRKTVGEIANQEE